jgi:5-(carboxyamino)imidazole ribonucleotide mutase
MKEVGIIMGSDSDLDVMHEAAVVLKAFGIDYEITVVSAHRTPERMFEYARTARERGIKVIIAGAGGAAHLPGMVAACTSLPVIGVPVQLKTLSGLDSLLSIVQMPGGVPVATVAINNAKNAGLLAVQILGVAQNSLIDKMDAYKLKMKEEVLLKAEKVEQGKNSIGFK